MKIHPLLLNPERNIVAGHRGIRAVYPENTLFSFEKAIELGVDMLEMDLNVTRDGELVVMHDTTVDRTTNGSGPIREKTLSEMKKLDAGIFMGDAFRGLTVPTFEEFLQLIDRHREILLNVEIKDRTEECVDKTMALLARHNLIENCVFACFDANIVKLIHRKYDLPCQGFPWFVMDHYERGLTGTISHLAAVGIEMSLLTPERVKDYEGLGVLPWAYCPDDEKNAAYALYCGTHLVTSNNPAPALAIFQK